MKKVLISVFLGFTVAGAKENIEIIAYYNPGCGCCHKYFKILESKGFKIKRVKVSYDELYRIKDKLGVPVDKRSCHTMQIGDKFIEGHVPAEGIEALLKDDKARGVFSPHGTLSGWGKEEDKYFLIR